MASRHIRVLTIWHAGTRINSIKYSDDDLKKFREIAATPIWQKWVADNKAKFDSQGLLDALLKELEKANAKHAAKR